MRISLGANQVSLSLLFICRDLITSYIIKKGLNFFFMLDYNRIELHEGENNSNP